MAGWLDLLVDARAIRAVYGEQVPGVTGISVHEITAQPDGRRVRVRFDLAEFPADPPAKWVAARHDTAQLTLSFEDTHRVRFAGPLTDDIADLVLAGEDPGVTALLLAPSFELTVRARWLVLSGISAYRRGA